MKPKIGDWVTIKKDANTNWNSSMDKFRGKTVKVTEVMDRGFHFEGDDNWYYQFENIESITYIPKVGDWVILKSKRPEGWNSKGEMDGFLGKTVCITHVQLFGDKKNAHISFDGSNPWQFHASNIERICDEPDTTLDLRESVVNNSYQII